MNSNLGLVLKYIAGAALFGLWAALVFAGKADAQPLVAAIASGIGALLGYHAVTNLQAVPKPPVVPPFPTIAPKEPS
jgi:hypothetical protein